MTYNPNAYLYKIRNVKTGLELRTKILTILEAAPQTAKETASKLKKTYSSIMRQLHHLRNEKLIDRERQKASYVWYTTGIGQKKLNELI